MIVAKDIQVFWTSMADPCTTVDILIVARHFKEIGKGKKLERWMPQELN